MTLRLKLNNLTVPLKIFTFPGGEEQVQIDMRYAPKGGVKYVDISAHIKTSRDVMLLVMVTDACRHIHNLGLDCEFSLHLPYIPYARQDRVMNEGEANSILAFTSLIAGLKFDKIIVDDPHSDVSIALLDNATKKLVVRSQDVLFDEHMALSYVLEDPDLIIIAPDAGARKKAQKISNRYHLPLVEASKTRDVSDGTITGTEVHGDVRGATCLIVDDIADGSYTFLKLGEALKNKGAKRVILYVTHGIFSKGVDILKGSIDEVYTYHPWMENIRDRNTHGLYQSTGYSF